jgi:hypothetical protein
VRSLQLSQGPSIWVGVDGSNRDWQGNRFCNATWKWVLGAQVVWWQVAKVAVAREILTLRYYGLRRPDPPSRRSGCPGELDFGYGPHRRADWLIESPGAPHRHPGPSTAE